MRIRDCISRACGLLICAALLTMPAVSGAADASTPVTCKDGTTSPHGGRGACSRHGGIDKAATKAAGEGTAAGEAAAGGAAAPTPGSSASTHPPSTQTHIPSSSAAPFVGPD